MVDGLNMVHVYAVEMKNGQGPPMTFMLGRVDNVQTALHKVLCSKPCLGERWVRQASKQDI